MKKLLLSLLAVAGAWTSAFAQDPIPAWQNDWTSAPATGAKFYLYNTEADGFIKGNMGKGSKFVSATDAGLWTKNSSNVSTQLSGKTYYLKMDSDEAFTNETNANSYARNYTYEFSGEKTSIVYIGTGVLAGNEYNFWKDKDGKFATSRYKGVFSSGKKVYEWYLINETQYANHMAYVAYYNEAVNAKTVDASAISKAWRDKHLYSFTFTDISNVNQVDELTQLTNEIKAWKEHPEKYALLKDTEFYPGISNKVTHIDVERTIKAGTWNTLCLPFGMDIPAGWTVKELSGVIYNSAADSYDAQFSTAASIEAGKPYIVMVSKEEKDIIRNEAEGFSVAPNETSVEVSSAENNGAKLFFMGILYPVDDLYGMYFINGGKFYYAAEPGKNSSKAYRALFTISGPSASPSAKLIYTVDGDEVTLIDAPELVPANDAPIFDLQGRRVNAPVSGKLYVKNGKKFVQQ